MSIFVKFAIIFSGVKKCPVKHIATYCRWDFNQIHGSCISMSLWWQTNPSLCLSWTLSFPNRVSILWHAACTPSDAKLLEGGVDFFTAFGTLPGREVTWWPGMSPVVGDICFIDLWWNVIIKGFIMPMYMFSCIRAICLMASHWVVSLPDGNVHWIVDRRIQRRTYFSQYIYFNISTCKLGYISLLELR